MRGRTGRVGVVGSLNLDRLLRLQALPSAGESVHAELVGVSPGGKGANQATAAALLGARVQLIGAVGADAAGDLLVAAASEKGVDVGAIQRADAPTGEATILVDADGENVIVIAGGANLELRHTAVEQLAPSTDIVVTGFEVPDEVVGAAARRADALGALFVLNPSPLRPLRREMQARRMLVILNESEAEGLGAQELAGSSLAGLSGLFGGSDLIVTRGGRGVIVYEAGSGASLTLEAKRVSAVDTSGCGDAFAGAVVAALARGEDLPAAAAYGRDAGALVATRRGTQSAYPTAAELEEWSRAQ